MSKRKRVEELILTTLDEIDVGSSKDNTAYYKTLFASMNDKQFDEFMIKLRDNKITLSMIIPNGGVVKVDVENNFSFKDHNIYDFNNVSVSEFVEKENSFNSFLNSKWL